MDTGAVPMSRTEHAGEDAPSVGVRLAAIRQGSPASAVEHHTCWLNGTGKPVGGVAGTLTRSLWAQQKRYTA